MAESTDGLYDRKIFEKFQAKFLADIERALQPHLLPDPVPGTSLHASSTVLTVEQLYEAASKLQAASGLPDPFQMVVPPSAYKRLYPEPLDADGTDLRIVDRMANPHRPGTPEHGRWMKQWANVQSRFQTQAYRDEKVRIDADRDRMNEIHGPAMAPGWADAVLAEIEDARAECEDVVHPDSHLRCFLDEAVEDARVKVFTRDEPVPPAFSQVIDFSDLADKVVFSDIEFTRVEDNPDTGVVKYHSVARVNAPSVITISVV